MQGGTKLWPICDGLGSVYAWVDRSGNVVGSYSYDVYGTRTQTSGTVNVAWGYTGREHDADTGLNYNRDRYLAPGFATWTQADRLGIDANGPNLYQYVLSNPVRYTDKYGTIRDSITMKMFASLATGDIAQAAYYMDLLTGTETATTLAARLYGLLGPGLRAFEVVKDCSVVAAGVLEIFKQLGLQTTILKATPIGSKYLGWETRAGVPTSTITVSNTGYHYAIESDGYVYDKYTGVGGLPRDEWVARLVTEEIEGATVLIEEVEKIEEMK